MTLSDALRRRDAIIGRMMARRAAMLGDVFGEAPRLGDGLESAPRNKRGTNATAPIGYFGGHQLAESIAALL